MSLNLPASYRYLHLPGLCIRSILEGQESRELAETMAYNIELAVYETCTNIIDHAYRDTTGRIQLTFSLKTRTHPRQLEINIVDTGASFDFGLKQDEVPEPGQEHGYGLFLVRQLMDEVDYSPEPEKNVWRLVKNL